MGGSIHASIIFAPILSEHLDSNLAFRCVCVTQRTGMHFFFMLHVMLCRRLVLVGSVLWASFMLIVVPVIFSTNYTPYIPTILVVSAHTVTASMCGFDIALACIGFLGTQYAANYILLFREQNLHNNEDFVKLAWTGATITTILALFIVAHALWKRFRREHPPEERQEMPTGIPVPIYVEHGSQL